MRLSIYARMALITNGLLVVVSLAIGALAVQAVGRGTERRLLEDSVANAARIVEEMNLPADSPVLLRRIGQILGVHAATGPQRRAALTASSLPPEQQRELADRVAQSPQLDSVTLAGTAYRVAWAPLERPGVLPGERSEPMRLCLLVPFGTIERAKWDAARSLLWVLVPAMLAGTLAVTLVARTVARPVRELADHVSAVSRQLAAPDARADLGLPYAAPPSAPVEVARLSEAFERLRVALGEARDRIERSARLATLGTLSASVVHELRNPLGGIRMNAQLLGEELRGRGIEDESLDLIVREIDRLDGYLQELLALGTGGGGDGSESPVPVDLREVVESARALLAHRARSAGVAIETDYAPVPQVRGQASPVRQVVLNLMMNALDAMSDGGTMRITLHPFNGSRADEPRADGPRADEPCADTPIADGPWVRLSVADSGGGVRAREGEDIFEPFVTSRPRGAGLGLFVCRRIAQRFGGRIEYDSTGRGATFHLVLPPAGKAKNPSPPGESGLDPSPPGEKMSRSDR